MHDAGENAHERRIRMPHDRKADEGEHAVHKRRDHHAAHIAADGTREDRDHKPVTSLALPSHDDANLAVDARIIERKPVRENDPKKDDEEL